MAAKIAVLFALVAVALANPPPSYAPRPSYQPAQYADTPPQYAYNYGVKDDYAGVDFGQDESRDGYNTYGNYYVQLPDGRLQKVAYSVDGEYGGYVADVTYEGEPRYDEYKPSPSYHKAPSYAPAPYHPRPAYPAKK